HSHTNHLYALLKLCKKKGLKRVFVHCITDGRDVPPDSAKQYIADLEAKILEIGVGKIASIVGRYFYMDRDNRWERVEKGYHAVFEGEGAEYTSADAGVAASYALAKFDEFIEPIIVDGYDGVKKGDSMIFYNFRSDRAREISEAILTKDFASFTKRGGHKDIFYVGMTQYDASFKGIHTAFAPKDITNTLGEYLAKLGKTQARVAETEKYAHVTFFFNGGVETANKGEERILVRSPEVATYDLKPEMSAYEVTEKALGVIGKVDVLILNYANCDMVGHTGIMSAAVKAVNVVDGCVKKITDKILKVGGNMILTADHGNAEQMSFESGAPFTAHTTNPVRVIVVGEGYERDKAAIRKGGGLNDVAPTLLSLMGLEKPKEMDGTDLVVKI
ncbi:MAG: 2,3-bisphosphoglycerate-independent phosphoglycerate mutase, partial [Firmicutes bacterium]|nr:2,3-bisphosphoglycerate-independent phosphoglycerate mutase [Bacillota bacterium]